MVIQSSISVCSIVLLGKFNPAILHPAWLEARGIEPEATSHVSDLLSLPEVSSFSIETRSYVVQSDRYQIDTTAAPWVTVLDITNKIFGEHLFHTPITAVGVNRQVHFSLPSRSSRVRLGRKLAPIEHWGQFGQGMDTDDVELTGGLQSLSMQQKSLVGGVQMETNVTIEPSVRNRIKGVYMHVNSHHLLTELPADHGSEQAMTLLMERFEPATEEADTIIKTIMRLES